MKTYTSRLAYLVIAITACIALLTTACKKEPDKSTASTDKSVENTENKTPAESAAAEEVAVTVNGVNIYESQVEEKLEPQLARMAKQMPPAIIEQYKKPLRQQILDSMIIEQLLDQKVKEEKIEVTDQEVMSKIEDMAAQQEPPLSLEDFKALVEALGQNLDDVKLRIKRGLGYKNLMEAQWEGKVNITEDEAKKYYSENTSEFETPEQIRVSHILITTETSDPNTDPNQAKEAAKEKAETLRAQIDAGADFAELAKLNSSCPSSQQGGDLGFFGRHEMVPAFEDTAFALKPGEVSDVVETQFGYHIIMATDHKDPNTVTFEEVKEDLMKMLTQKEQAELAKEYIESLKANANIVYPAAPASKPKTGTEQNQ